MNNRSAARKKVTIRTIADDAGVSTSAVSKVLRNAYGVSDSMREKVLKSIDKFGYRPSTAARGMRGRTYTMGMLLVDVSNPFLPAVIDSVKSSLRQQNYDLMISVSDGRRQIENSLIESLIDMRMDGLILVAPQCDVEVLESYARQIPMVVIGHHCPGSAVLDTVNSDDTFGGRLVVEALIAKGYRRIHMISLPPDEGDAADVNHVRETGYLAAMEQAGCAEHAQVVRMSQRPEGLDNAVTAFLEQDDLPEAIFCWSDLHAVAIIDRARALGIKVPDDLAIIGYDNSPIAGMSLVGLASVDQLPDELGSKAVEQLLSRAEGRQEAQHFLIPPRLIVRGSY